MTDVPMYPDYRWRRKWRLGNWYVAQLLIFSALTMIGASVMYSIDKLPERVLIGMLLIPGFIILWAGMIAGVNSMRMAFDRWYGSEDGVDWPEEQPLTSYWTQGHKGLLLFHFNYMATFYVFPSGFGYVGGAIQRAFVPWEHVVSIDQRMFRGVIEYARNGNRRRLSIGTVKPILEAWRKADGKRR